MVVMSELTSGSPIDLSCHPKNQICPIINARASGKYLEELLLHGHGWKSRIVDDYLRKGVDSDLNYETGESTTDGKKRSSVMSDSGPSVSGPSLRASLPDAPSEGSLPQGTRVGSKTLKATSLSDADVVIHPTQPAPDKACVESSLHRLGLPSVQATSVFCSDLHTPDQKLELGGKVLKVDSRRLCQMSEFTISGRHVLGLKKWRVKTERRMLSEQQPDLQVAAPVWPPPRQDTVLKWLAAGNKQQTMEHSALHPGDSSADDSLVSSLSSLADGASPCGPSPLIASDLDICSPHMSDKSFSLLLTKTPITLGKRKSKLTGVNQTKTYCNSQEDVSALSKKIRKTENKDRYPSLSSTPVNFHVDLGDGADKRHVLTQTQRRDSSTLTTDVSQIEGPTPKNTFGFKIAQTHVQDSKAIHKFQYVSTLCLELHIETRGDLRPDPAVDPVLALFYSVLDDVPASQKKSKLTGVVLVDLAKVSPSQKSPLSEGLLDKCAVDGLDVSYVQDELDLIQTFSQLVLRWDPDILVGYEIQMLSWGYLLHRAAHLNIDLCSQIARIPDEKDKNTFDAETNEWGAAYTSEIQVAGRIVLNMWRVIKHEVALNVYTFENVVYHVLHRRIPLYSFRSLTRWYTSKTYLQRWRVFEHYVRRVKGLLEVIDQLDLIGKTSEFARVFGIEFYDVLARGSQIRVESMMLRLAKPLNYVAVSPSVSQRAGQRAAECIPLTLEPESQYYTSPVVVLDFQSLYPSIMIAYNYCFSTCLGRLECLENSHEGPFEFGCSSLNIDPKILSKEKDNVTVSPNGVVFIKSSVRKGVLPMMVEEILKTRLMVKKSMKASKDDKILTRMLDARQLSLKLIANVTYGYTGASFSGRMPCIEVGDSIVRKARESLERAIDLVSTTSRWGAQVVYGDTDSLFLHFPGRSKDEAFSIGQEIADAVTAMFPSPIKLKFEKVYLPCVLQTKKHYVGFMYETPDQKEPVFDAKGIETVRRDSCAAVSKILERSIKILFTSNDLWRVQRYVSQQLQKLVRGKVSMQDLIFAKEFRGLMGYRPGACVPALEIARKRLKVDPRSEPRVGERVPYVIVHGSPGLPLIQLVREPHQVLQEPALRLNTTYYISKQILPPLQRLFGLIGLNVFKWYQDMPKVMRCEPMLRAGIAKQGTISQFFSTESCPVCEKQTKTFVCQSCAANPQMVCSVISRQIYNWEKTNYRLTQVCLMCQGTQDGRQLTCISLDCPVMFRRVRAQLDLSRADNLQQMLNQLF